MKKSTNNDILIVIINYECSFSCSQNASSADVNIKDIKSIFSYIENKMNLTKDRFDEILIINNNRVVSVYTYENGLNHV
jgi:hypothetical protein